MGSIHNNLKEYLDDVKWLREHVAPDDIYDFAQQTVMASQYFIYKINQILSQNNLDFGDLLIEDDLMEHWVNNIFSLSQMKDDNFKGIINVSWREID